MQAADRNPRWRLTNRKYLYLRLNTTLQKNSNGDKYVYKVEKFNEDISNTVWCKQRSEIQDGGSQTGNTYISAYIQYSCTIPTVVSMFSWSRNSIRLFSIICDASERQKSKMVTPQQEILMFVSRHLGFLTYLASHTVNYNSFSEFFAFENMGIAQK